MRTTPPRPPTRATFVAAALLAIVPLHACTPLGGAAAGADVVPVATTALAPDARAVLETVETIFRGMRNADSALIRSVFHHGARFAMLTDGDGGDGGESVETIRYARIDGWLAAVADSERRWDERIYDVDILVDRPIATAWTPYTFYLDGRVRHCGVNAIALLLTDAGWKVTQLSDSRRQDGCPDPLASTR